MSLGALEREVMGLCWRSRDALTVRDALLALNNARAEPLAYTTVMTVMARLAEKGILIRSPRGRGYAYTPAVTDEAAIAVREVLEMYGTAAVAHFAVQASADPELRTRLRKLLDESG